MTVAVPLYLELYVSAWLMLQLRQVLQLEDGSGSKIVLENLLTDCCYVLVWDCIM